MQKKINIMLFAWFLVFNYSLAYAEYINPGLLKEDGGKGFSAIPAPTVINDVCALPLIIIPAGCIFTSLLIFNDANYYIEVVKDTKTELARDGLVVGAAASAVNAVTSSSTLRSSAGAGVRFKEVNVWELSATDKEGTFIEDVVKQELCIWNDDPGEGGYVYQSKKHERSWKLDDDGSFLSSAACGLSDLPDAMLGGLTSAIPGLSEALDNCVGGWGTLKPRIGFATHASDVVHAAHVGYRGLSNAGDARGIGVDGMQFGHPRKKGCFKAGEPTLPSMWDVNVKNPMDFFGENDTFLIVIWQREACCMQ